jgi:hypothetical protein
MFGISPQKPKMNRCFSHQASAQRRDLYTTLKIQWIGSELSITKIVSSDGLFYSVAFGLKVGGRILYTQFSGLRKNFRKYNLRAPMFEMSKTVIRPFTI